MGTRFKPGERVYVRAKEYNYADEMKDKAWRSAKVVLIGIFLIHVRVEHYLTDYPYYGKIVYSDHRKFFWQIKKVEEIDI